MARTPDWLGSALAVTEPERAEAGPTALLIVILLGIGIFFLGRSMIKHIRRVPTTFDDATFEDPMADDPAAAAPPAQAPVRPRRTDPEDRPAAPTN